MKILRYGFSNYYSFKDKQIVSFVMPKTISQSCYSYPSESGECVTPILCVMGHNGSGKTNLLKPLPFLSFLLQRTYDPDDDYSIPFIPFMDDSSTPTKMFVEYEFDGIDFKYEIELTKDKIISEKLSGKWSSRYSYIFKRTTKEKHIEVKSKSSKNVPHVTKFESIDKRTSMIAVYLATSTKEEEEVLEFIHPLCRLLCTNIRHYGKAPNTASIILNAADRLHKNPERFGLLKEIITQLDIGLDDIIVSEIEYIDRDSEKSKVINMPMGVHRTADGKEFKLPMTRESSGTQALFIAIEQVLEVIDNGGIAVLDEVDSDLHPYMLKELLDLLSQEELNTKNAQILFTSHSPEILNVLNKYQVYLVEKDDCASTAYRADNVEGLRLDDNLYKKYMSGSLGGVPQI